MWPGPAQDQAGVGVGASGSETRIAVGIVVIVRRDAALTDDGVVLDSATVVRAVGTLATAPRDEPEEDTRAGRGIAGADQHLDSLLSDIDHRTVALVDEHVVLGIDHLTPVAEPGELRLLLRLALDLERVEEHDLAFDVDGGFAGTVTFEGLGARDLERDVIYVPADVVVSSIAIGVRGEACDGDDGEGRHHECPLGHRLDEVEHVSRGEFRVFSSLLGFSIRNQPALCRI